MTFSVYMMTFSVYTMTFICLYAHNGIGSIGFVMYFVNESLARSLRNPLEAYCINSTISMPKRLMQSTPCRYIHAACNFLPLK